MSTTPDKPQRQPTVRTIRLWNGFTLSGWMHLLARNRFAIPPTYWLRALLITQITLFNQGLSWLQRGLLGSRVRSIRVPPPLFIIGHWRTGTTLLHELLSLDTRFQSPTTYRCLAPNHFLVSESWLKGLASLLTPRRRPMDNMALGMDLPQEDEFALALLDLPSPYLMLAFPQQGPIDQEAFDVETLRPRDQRRWKAGFTAFLQDLTYRDPRRLILKSPPHTCRIPTLLELYPDAQFVFLIRNPYVLYHSTLNLWRRLAELHSMQAPRLPDLEEYVLNTFVHLDRRYEQTKSLLRPDQLVELKYEDLVADPEAQLSAIYDRLHLGDFESVRPHIRQYLGEHTDYQTNRYPTLTPAERERITAHWGETIHRYGYTVPGGEA